MTQSLAGAPRSQKKARPSKPRSVRDVVASAKYSSNPVIRERETDPTPVWRSDADDTAEKTLDLLSDAVRTSRRLTLSDLRADEILARVDGTGEIALEDILEVAEAAPTLRDLPPLSEPPTTQRSPAQSVRRNDLDADIPTPLVASPLVDSFESRVLEGPSVRVTIEPAKERDVLPAPMTDAAPTPLIQFLFEHLPPPSSPPNTLPYPFPEVGDAGDSDLLPATQPSSMPLPLLDPPSVPLQLTAEPVSMPLGLRWPLKRSDYAFEPATSSRPTMQSPLAAQGAPTMPAPPNVIVEATPPQVALPAVAPGVSRWVPPPPMPVVDLIPVHAIQSNRIPAHSLAPHSIPAAMPERATRGSSAGMWLFVTFAVLVALSALGGGLFVLTGGDFSQLSFTAASAPVATQPRTTPRKLAPPPSTSTASAASTSTSTPTSTSTSTSTPTSTPTSTSTSTSTPTPTPTSNAIPVLSVDALPRVMNKYGMLHVAAGADVDGHRIYVDGAPVGNGAGDYELLCGKHAVRVGSSGKARVISVPCGGDASF